MPKYRSSDALVNSPCLVNLTKKRAVINALTSPCILFTFPLPIACPTFRIVRAFLVEEQKIVKKVLKQQQQK